MQRVPWAMRIKAYTHILCASHCALPRGKVYLYEHTIFYVLRTVRCRTERYMFQAALHEKHGLGKTL